MHGAQRGELMLGSNPALATRSPKLKSTPNGATMHPNIPAGSTAGTGAGSAALGKPSPPS